MAATTAARSPIVAGRQLGDQLLQRLRRERAGDEKEEAREGGEEAHGGLSRSAAGARGGFPRARGSGQLVVEPPHLPVATLKLPQDIGARQSAIRSFDSGR